MICECGHVEDEHSLSGECQIEECPCAGFDPVPDKGEDR
jgi:hypothetical protein